MGSQAGRHHIKLGDERVRKVDWGVRCKSVPFRIPSHEVPFTCQRTLVDRKGAMCAVHDLYWQFENRD